MTERGDRASLADFERLLGPARGKIRRAGLCQALVNGADRALLAGAIVAAAFLLLRLIGPAVTGGARLGWDALLVVLIAAALLAVLATVAVAWRRSPPLREVAERLDLAAHDHNRVATAVWLLKCDRRSAFAVAAIGDGYACLKRVGGNEPNVEPIHWRPRRWAGAAVTLAVLLVAAGLCEGPADGRSGDNTLALAAAGSGTVALRPEVERDERPEQLPAREAAHRPALASERREGGAEPTAGQTARLQTDLVAGRAAGSTRARADIATQAAAGAGESAQASAEPAEREAQKSKPRKSKRGRDAKTNGKRGESRRPNSSSIGQGSSGGGTSAPVRHDWGQKARTLGNDREDEEEADEEVEDENESNTQRGGIQPLVKDRTEAPSRDLGISGMEGPPGTGRGGPTPPKKSRGTASLVLGVPIPDFVKGRLGPGTTKIVHERIDPAPMPGPRDVPAAARTRSLAESPISQFTASAEWAELVRTYLIALHSSGAATTTPGETPAVDDASALQE